MELKVVCGCGQKFKFDVEPVNGLMPFGVNCPICGKDGTAAANALIPQLRAPPPPLPALAPQPVVMAPPPAPTPSVSIGSAPPALAQPSADAPKLQINRVATPPPIAPPEPPKFIPAAAVMGAAVAPPKKSRGEFSLGLGIVGALLGAAIGTGIMFAFYQWVGFRFPLLGTITGLLCGAGAKVLGRGTDIALGAVAGAIALLSVVATLYLMYGTFPMISIISVLIGVSAAYRIASG